MMRTGLNILGCHSAEAVIVGDRMDTDVISGMECGMATVLVLSGVSYQKTIYDFSYRPTSFLNGVGDIVEFAKNQKTKKSERKSFFSELKHEIIQSRIFSGFYLRKKLYYMHRSNMLTIPIITPINCLIVSFSLKNNLPTITESIEVAQL